MDVEESLLMSNGSPFVQSDPRQGKQGPLVDSITSMGEIWPQSLLIVGE